MSNTGPKSSKIDPTEIPLNLERQLCHLLSMKPRTVVAKVAVAMHLTSQTANYGFTLGNGWNEATTTGCHCMLTSEVCPTTTQEVSSDAPAAAITAHEATSPD